MANVKRGVGLLLIVWALPAAAATCADPAPEILTGYRAMYDLDFSAAHHIFGDWSRAHPDDPMGPVSDGAAWVFAEFDRLHILESEFFTNDGLFASSKRLPADSNVKRAFDSDIARGRALGAKILAQNTADSSAALALMMASGMESDYLALVEKRYIDSLGEMKASRKQAEQLLQAHPDCADGYLAIGIENYILGLKPMPVRWILRMGGAQTSQEEGVAKLQITADKGHLLQPFARLMIAVAALRAKDPKRAEQILAGLVQEFPHNHLYRTELAKMQSAHSH